MLEFRILGPLEVRLAGEPVALPGSASRRALAALVVRAGEWVSSERLIDDVWGERPPASARKALQMHVSRLRRALAGGGRVLAGGPAGYRLDVAREQVDVARFERLLGEGRDALAAGDPQAARELLARALELWRGPPLAELELDGALAAEMGRLEELRLAALEQRMDADLRLGRHAELIGELRWLVSEHPWRERLHAHLMLALYRAGRQAEALQAYHDARTVLVDQLGIEPAAELRDLHQAMLEHDRALEPERAAASPPSLQPRLVGRDEELDAVRALVEDPARRLVTITGPGGVGKTRLAIEIAAAAGGRFVSLASTAAAEHAAGAIRDGLDLPRMPGETPEDALMRVLARARTLLVLDNLEHLVAVGPLLTRLLEHAPGLTILSTSRQPLGLAAEQVFALQPFPTEDAASPAVELFAERARARDPGFAVTAENLPSLVEVCRRVNGLPLAIELAAGRLRLLDLEQLARRLSDPLGVLGPGPRDAPTRHRTLRATLDWSFSLLDADERAAFAALGVFAGGCDTDAAEAVTGQPLPVVEALVEHSLVTSRDGRLTLMEPIRQYAAERLAARPDAHAVRWRHAAYFRALAESAYHDVWARGRSSPAFARLHRERDNLRGALAWSLDEGDPRDALALAGALGEYFVLTVAHDEGCRWCSRALARAGDDAPVALVARARGAWSDNLHDTAVALEHADAALALFRAIGDDTGVARSLIRVSVLLARDDELAPAVEMASEALERGRRAGADALIGRALGLLAHAEPRVEHAIPLLRAAEGHLRAAGAIEAVGTTLSTAGFLALCQHADEHADALLADALDAARGVDSPFLLALIHGNRGLAALLRGRLADAAAAFREELAIAHCHAFRVFYFEGLLGFAAIAAAHGEDERAAALEAAALEHNDRPVWTSEQPVIDRLERQFLGAARARLGHDGWARARRAGLGLSPEAAIALSETVAAPHRIMLASG